MCVAECPDPFVPNSDNICACPEGLTGSNCEIGERCSLHFGYTSIFATDVISPVLTFPVNGAMDSINRTFNTVVAYSCCEEGPLIPSPLSFLVIVLGECIELFVS